MKAETMEERALVARFPWLLAYSLASLGPALSAVGWAFIHQQATRRLPANVPEAY